MVLKIGEQGLFKAGDSNSKNLRYWSGYNSEGTISFIFSSSSLPGEVFIQITLCLTTKTKKKKILSTEQSTAVPVDSDFFRSVEHWNIHIALPEYWGELGYRKLITQTRFESTPHHQLFSYFRWRWVWCPHVLLVEKCWHFCRISSFSYFS